MPLGLRPPRHNEVMLVSLLHARTHAHTDTHTHTPHTHTHTTHTHTHHTHTMYLASIKSIEFLLAKLNPSCLLTARSALVRKKANQLNASNTCPSHDTWT